MKKWMICLGMFLMVSLLQTVPSLAAYSGYWKQDSGGFWYVEKPDGTKVRNAWICDDAVLENGKNIWYLVDGEGHLVTDGLLRDRAGFYYSTETEHNGCYGMLRYQSGTYAGISLSLCGDHHGAFASIQNEDGIFRLSEICGVRDLGTGSEPGIVYTSSFEKEGGRKDTAAAKESTVYISEKKSAEEPDAVEFDGWPQAMEIDADLTADLFLSYLNDYREELGLSPLIPDAERAEYAKERAERNSISHEGNTMGYEILGTGGFTKSDFAGRTAEEAVAYKAFTGFRKSKSHNGILKMKTLETAGAGFLILESEESGRISGYVAEANFGTGD